MSVLKIWQITNVGLSKVLAVYSRALWKARFRYCAHPQQEYSQPSLVKTLASGSTDTSKCRQTLPQNTCAETPKQDSSVCLRAANPLLALIDRPGSVRDFVIDGILTEPLNTVRLSWGRRFCNADTHNDMFTYWLQAQPWMLWRPQNILKSQSYQSWVIWAASQQNLQNNILQFSAEPGSTRNATAKCWITWTYADNWKSRSNNLGISLKGRFASLSKLL